MLGYGGGQKWTLWMRYRRLNVEMELKMYFVQKFNTRHPGESAIVMGFHVLGVAVTTEERQL